MVLANSRIVADDPRDWKAVCGDVVPGDGGRVGTRIDALASVLCRRKGYRAHSGDLTLWPVVDDLAMIVEVCVAAADHPRRRLEQERGRLRARHLFPHAETSRQLIDA